MLSDRMHSFDSQSQLKICASRNEMITVKTLIVQPLLLVAIVTTALVDRSHHIKTDIGDKIVETLYTNRVTSENERNHPPPPLVPSSQSWGVCCFL